MKGSKLALVSLALWGLTVVVAVFFFFRGSTHDLPDQRKEIQVTPAERELVLKEMRTILASVNGVVTGLSQKDMKKVEESARAAGMIMAVEENAALVAKLPFEFKEMGLGLHRGFDELADTAKNGASQEEILQRMAGLTARCNGCHDFYRVGGAGSASADLRLPAGTEWAEEREMVAIARAARAQQAEIDRVTTDP